MKKLLIFLTLFSILFISSGQTYEQQTLIPALQRYLPSEPFKGFLSLFQIPYWGMTISIEERGYYPFVEFLIRKASHVVIFGLIALAVLNMLPKPKVWIAFTVTSAIAFVDEYHQSLTGGRTPTLHDVLLDMFGAALFLGAWLLWKNCRHETAKPFSSERD